MRREFIKKAAAISTLGISMPSLLKASAEPEDNAGGQGYTFLFQGDSITDGNRTRNTDWNHVMGHGYAYLIACRLGFDLPQKDFHFFNRGISGNKITDLAARWEKDTLDIKPDLLSILIGINDTEAAINSNASFTVTAYETGYRALLQQTKEKLPTVQLVLCEPFILPVGRVKDKWEQYAEAINKRREVVAKLAEEFDAIFVGLQAVFDKAAQKAPAAYWIWDGIHPMPAGHELMAREWIKQVSRKIKFIR
jgi:lysophospholipase L1-like esterase